ncbi:hypothetical protein [Sneathiella glossodoripedis]|uniref:hypothetical protein n=1 Tax=Sneathiella glossodoripedis TaxID=418853 RepID=UPI0004728AE1|nr:hypothetical protein [Sneathiella glossodoripedis]
MQNLINEDDFDESNGAASLSRIQVRKPKSPDATKSNAPVKAGDITERLAALSRDLDASLGTDPAPGVQAVSPNINPTQPKPAQSARPRKTGWGTPKSVQTDILGYWMDIRQSRRYPSWQSLDPQEIGIHWPNCLLVHCNKEVGRLQVKYEFTNAVRKVALNNITDEERIDRIEFTPMIVDWILSLARDVSLSGKPAHGTEQFPSLKGEFPLRLIALPLSDDLRSIDHVLCYIQQLR